MQALLIRPQEHWIVKEKGSLSIHCLYQNDYLIGRLYYDKSKTYYYERDKRINCSDCLNKVPCKHCVSSRRAIAFFPTAWNRARQLHGWDLSDWDAKWTTKAGEPYIDIYFGGILMKMF